MDDIEILFAMQLWSDTPLEDDNGKAQDDADSKLADAAVELFLDEKSLVFHCVPCSGTTDRDAITQGSLSPMLKLVLVGEYASVEHVQDFEGLARASHKDAPIRKLNDRWNDLAPFFKASFCMQAKHERKQEGIYDYGTGFALSNTRASSALHLRFTQANERICAWRGMYGEVRQQQFESNKLPRFHLKELSLCMVGNEPEMIDPVTECIYDVQHLNRVDDGVWEIESNLRSPTEHFESPKNPIILKFFSKVLIPMSLSMEVEYGEVSDTNQACGMVHYAMVEKVRDELNAELASSMSQDELQVCLRERIKLFTANCRVIASEMESVLRGQSLKEFLKKDKGAGSRQVKSWFIEMRRRIMNLISQKNDGDIFLGVGRVVKWNETMVAHSVSTFPGSSGGALFLIDAIPGCFIAIHNSPASVSIFPDRVWTTVPDHNLACNVENAAFGKMYFVHVLPEMTMHMVGKDREKVLCRFLAFHLETILSSYPCTAWSSMQTAWLQKMVEHLSDGPPRQTKRDLRDDFGNADTLEHVQVAQANTYWRDMSARWRSAIINAGPDCIAAMAAEKLLEKLDSFTKR